MASPTTEATKKAVWLAPENKLVEDAVSRLMEACPPDKIICRAFPFRRELANVLSLGPNEPRLIDDSTSATTSDVVKALQKAYNDQVLRDWKETDPCHFAHSISEYAKRRAAKNPDVYGEYLDAMKELVDRPDVFASKRKVYMALARELLCDSIESCDVICSTPASIGELQDIMVGRGNPFIADLVVLDEATRVTEASSAIIFSQFPQANFLFLGDTADVPDNTNSTFGPQRQTSLFARIAAAGKITVNFSELEEQERERKNNGN